LLAPISILAVLGAGLSAAREAEPARSAWILGLPSARVDPRIRPDVHSVEVQDSFVIVRSAGISLRHLGLLQPAPRFGDAAREFLFRIPRRPEAETARRSRVPAGVAGVFLNGVPIYNPFEALSYNGANLWHYDPVAASDDGTLTAAGHPRPERTHAAVAGLLERLIGEGTRHSPLIGFALDGYPVYGPWSTSNPDGTGALRRMRSSYRLRALTQRREWPDGTVLTPEQYGPEVVASDPLGTFAEDYEYAPGSGDLDESNGRFSVTPEYPNGTYAYFLTTDARGRLAYPYLIGPRFRGKVPSAGDSAFFPMGRGRLEVSASRPAIEAGRPIRFRFEARRGGERVRHFEHVHERPIHLLIASHDLAELEHIHPELAEGDVYEVTHTFAHGGRYRMWADFSLPGEAPAVESFDITVQGRARAQEVSFDRSLTRRRGALQVELTHDAPLRAGCDIPMTLRLTGGEELQPYLGAWAHVILVSRDVRTFAHVHPLEAAGETASGGHAHAAAGSPPGEVRIMTSFPRAGRYRLWAQFQLSGEVVTLPFVLDVAPGAARQTDAVPAGAFRIRVTQRGYEPARLEVPANEGVQLAFTSDSAPNCGAEVVFASLGIRRKLPSGETVIVQIPAAAAGEIAFSCGMGMYRGLIVAR